MFLYQKEQYIMSLPAWGEWIEMPLRNPVTSINRSLPAWGEWIEIVKQYDIQQIIASLSPHGESGLKSLNLFFKGGFIMVSPRMGRVD